MVCLKEVTVNNLKECLKLSVFKHQTQFVSSVSDSLAKAYVCEKPVFPFAIYSDDIVVGFVMLCYNPCFNNYYITHFFIDAKHLGNEYEKQALSLAIDWMRMDPRCNEIVTTQKVGNRFATSLFKAFGFTQSSVTADELNLKLLV